MTKRILLIFFLLVFISCGPVVLIPPEIDLMSQKQIGLIDFAIENAEGPLDKMATQRFLQEITRAQRGVQIIELGPRDVVLKKIGKNAIDQEAAKTIGERFGVKSFFHGDIRVSDVKPEINISALIKSLRVRASFNISITSRLISTETGATLWTDSVDRKESLAYLRYGPERIPYFNVQDQDKAYRRLVEQIIYDLTWDFRPTKQRLEP